jgi:hypothetical protein
MQEFGSTSSSVNGSASSSWRPKLGKPRKPKSRPWLLGEAEPMSELKKLKASSAFSSSPCNELVPTEREGM